MRMCGVIHLWLVCFSVFMYPLTTFMKKKTKPCGVYVKALIPCPISRESDSSGPGRDPGVCILISFLGESGQQALHLALASAGRVGGVRLFSVTCPVGSRCWGNASGVSRRWGGGRGQEAPVHLRERLLSVEKTVTGLPGMTLGGPACLRMERGYREGSVQCPLSLSLP